MIREIQSRVHKVGHDQIEWPFRSAPHFTTKGPTTHERSHQIDPFPCYPHDASLVAEVAERVESLFPVDDQVDYFLPEFEEISRTNGYADKSSIYDQSSGKWTHWEPIIVLIGKRIPPHPAMTRYLVAHEFGHIVQWQIEKNRGIDSDKETTDLDFEYMRMRPGSHNKSYGGGKWHDNVGELLANDFRILVCGVEAEFWPHAGFPRPDEVEEVKDFWQKVVAEAHERSAKASQAER